MQFTVNLKAGQLQRQQTAGRFFLILSTGAAPTIGVTLFDGSRELENIRTAARGFKARVWNPVEARGFSHVDFLAAVDCTVELIISDGLVDFDFIAGAAVNATIVGPLPLPVQNDRGGAPGTPLYVSGLTLSDTPAVTLQDDAAVAIGPAAAVIVAANAARKALRIANIGTDPMTIGAAGITWAKRCIVLEPGDVWVEERGANLAWYGITDAAKSASATAQEVIA